MKKILLILFASLLALMAAGQVSVTVNVATAGSFSTALTTAGGNPGTVTNLTVTGNINSADINYMRINMPVLAVLNLEAVSIVGNTMPSYAFSGKTTLTSIKMPASIVSIGSGAFLGCIGLAGTLTIPNTVKSIGGMAFYSCYGLTGSLTIPQGVDTIGANAFYDCTGLSGALNIPNSVKYIGNAAFNNCYGFTGSLTIPNSVTYIGDDAFYGCYGFTGSLTIPNSVTTIGSEAFFNCSGFKDNLTISHSVTIINSKTFENCSGFTGTLTIPNLVTTIGEAAFRNCSSFTGLSISGSVKSINNSAFASCSGFTGYLIIPDGVTFLGSSAFYGCSGFSGNLIIPNSITTIYGGVFSGCSGLKGTLTLPNAVKSIDGYAFSNCGFTGDLIFPNSVTAIGSHTFEGCSGFTGNLTIPGSVTSIGDAAFYGCKFTGTLTIPNSVTAIGYYVFGFCTGFTGDLIIPNSVASIGGNAFYGCTGFNGTISISNTVNSIGDGSFGSCSGVTKISVNISIPPAIASGTFYGVNTTTCELIVPVGAKTAYQAANYWKYFTKITEAIFVTYNSQGGSVIPTANTTSGSTISAPTPPTRTGYTFGGWYKEAGCTNVWNFASDVVTTNLTLYAKWTINTYSVTFNSVGGSSVPTITVNYGTMISSPAPPTRTGYTFDDWYVNQEYSYSWDFMFDVVTTDIIFYANWIINSYTVSFNSQGGSSVADITANYNTTITAPAPPTIVDYHFAGWYKETGCINVWDFATDKITSNTTLYARWSNTFSVRFNTLGGSSISDITTSYNTIVTAPTPPTLAGYTFAGWYKERGYLNAWDFASDMVTIDVTLYAKWNVNSYYVSFNTQGGSSVADITANYNTTISEPAPPTLTGYAFAGWYKEKNCVNAWDFATDKVSSNTILYAKWTSVPTSTYTSLPAAVKLYPNPASEFVTVEGENIKQIALCDLSGKILMQIDMPDKKSYAINVRELKAGSYLISLKMRGDSIEVIKLLKK
jgi:uncharacterized repeat protein (TIGR02543 family)